MYGWLTAGVLTLVLGKLLWGAVEDNAQLKVVVEDQAGKIETLQLVNNKTVASFEECQDINERNTEQLRAVKEQARSAEVRLATLDARVEASLERVAADTELMRSIAHDETCRLLTDPLPDVFFD